MHRKEVDVFSAGLDRGKLFPEVEAVLIISTLKSWCLHKNDQDGFTTVLISFSSPPSPDIPSSSDDGAARREDELQEWRHG